MSRYPSADGTGQKRALMAPGAVETMGDIVRDFRNETLGTGCWMQLQAKEGVNKSVEKWVKGADGREDRRMIRRNIITVFTNTFVSIQSLNEDLYCPTPLPIQ